MSVKRVDDVRAEAVSVGTGTTRQVLIGPDEGPHFANLYDLKMKYADVVPVNAVFAWLQAWQP